MKGFWWLVGIGLLVLFFTDSAEDQGSSDTSAPAVTTNDAQYLFVTGTRVNQRAGPGTTYGIMGQLNRGARVRLVEDSSGWIRIVSSVGNGWMSSQFLSPNRPPAPQTQTQTPRRQVAVPSTREIQNARAAIIRQSIAGYSGSCPCPYSRDRAGRQCGGRSAWSRPGGYNPICYDSDVSQSRIQSYFARQR